MSPALKQRLGTLALLAVAVVLSLLVGEAIVRWLRPGFVAGPDPIRNPFWRYDADLGWSHEPGATGTFARDEFSHPVRINREGWRDRERARDKPDGSFRVVVLGDSFTWGHGVGDEAIYTRLLERELPGTEVLNMGLSGSDTGQQLLILEEQGLGYHPDLVLLMVSRNDFAGILSDMEGSYPKPRFLLDQTGSLRLTNVPVPATGALQRWHYRMRRRSGLLNLVETLLEGSMADASPGRGSGRADAYALMGALLDRMQTDCRVAGAAFAISFVPSNAHTYPDQIPRIETERVVLIERFAREHGIPFLDLIPEFRAGAHDPATGERIDLHYRWDRHWNPRGHQVAAAALARMLVDQRLVPTDQRSRGLQ